MLTINAFSDGRTYVTGNRCDRGAGDMIQEKHKPVPNMVDVKLRRYFDYFLKKNIPEFEGKLRIGIPRVLNMYEDFPILVYILQSIRLRSGIVRLYDKGSI